MKVLVINASPRISGNSDILCDEFIRGAKESGNETEKINLTKMNISPCKACYYCGNSHTCAINDDMGEIQNKLMTADVIVLATPVYFYCMDAQMKMMIDRCLPHYLDIKDKKFWLIATAADTESNALDGTLMGLRGFLACLPNAKECGVISGTGAWEKGEIVKLPAMQKAYEAGKSIR
ncbi:MAG: flavodoxin family protein [Oscillospiraceae bacterium]|nr:flavodoxin family protein [Oscillospiraceae bacterium]